MKYKMIYDGDHFIDSVVHDSLEAAICDAEETLMLWAGEETSDWKYDSEKNILAPTEEQKEHWDYMIYNMGCYVVEYDPETGYQGDYLDDALWPKSQGQLDALGWSLWADIEKKNK